MSNKMTKKECLLAILEILDPVDSPELKAFCTNEINLLDKKAEKAKTKAAEKKNEVDALTAAIVAVIEDAESSMTINEVVAAVINEFPEVTNAKVSSRLSPLVKKGDLKKEEITISREKGKAKLVAYSKV